METDPFPLRIRSGLKIAIENIRGIESINSFINDCIEERLFDEERYDAEIDTYQQKIKSVSNKKKNMLSYQRKIVANLSPIEREQIIAAKHDLEYGKGNINGRFHRFRHETKNLTVSFALFRKMIDGDIIQ